MTERLSIDRDHALRGTKTLEWFFANRKWVRTAKLQIVECGWAKRPLPDGEAPIRFLILAPKRSYKRAHDRNRVKRLLRAAVTEVPAFVELETLANARAEQLLIMLRISKPFRNMSWSLIVSDAGSIALHLLRRTGTEVTP